MLNIRFPHRAIVVAIAIATVVVVSGCKRSERSHGPDKRSRLRRVTARVERMQEQELVSIFPDVREARIVLLPNAVSSKNLVVNIDPKGRLSDRRLNDIVQVAQRPEIDAHHIYVFVDGEPAAVGALSRSRSSSK